MSTDYSIFLRDSGNQSQVFAPLCEIDEVEYRGSVHIAGLHSVTCSKLSATHRDIMASEYGEYGLDVNWEIRGTYDKTTDILELMERLHRCAAVFVNSDFGRPLSLMRNAESFFFFNVDDRLVLSPTYLQAVPVIRSLFNKQFSVKEIVY